MRAFGTELKKILLSPFFLGSVAAVSILCLTAVCCTDHETGHNYSVLEVMIGRITGKIDPLKEYLYAEKVFTYGLSDWFLMFAPVILGLGTASVSFVEKRSGYRTFGITRTGKRKYALSKLFSCLLMGGLSCLAGFAVYGALAFAFLPHLKDMPQMYKDNILKIEFRDGIAKPLIFVSLAVFLYGIAMRLLPLIFSEVFRSLYTIVGGAFIIKYFCNTAYNGLQQTGLLPYDSVLFRILNIDALEGFYNYGKNSIYILLTHVLLVLLGSLIYVKLVEKKGAGLEKNFD